MTEIRCSSHREVAERLMALKYRARLAIRNAIARVVEDTIMAESQDEVPRLTGNLANSMGPLEIILDDNSMKFKITYNCEYAAAVHEIPPSYTHAAARTKVAGESQLDRMRRIGEMKSRTAWHDPPTKWKYLEDPFNRHVDELPYLILEELEKVLNEMDVAAEGRAEARQETAFLATEGNASEFDMFG